MSISFVNLLCAYCKNNFDFELKYYKYRIKENPCTKFYCSFSCRSKGQRNRVKVNCANCNIEVEKFPSGISKTGLSFCNSSCAATYNNKNIKRSENKKLKKANCKHCNAEIIVHAHTNIFNARCKNCKTVKVQKKQWRKKQLAVEKYCADCSVKIITINGKYCKDCIHNRRVETGKKSAQKQANTRRSKNEMYFAELCKQHFDNILENKAMFNGWDADVIIPSLSLAVLWNGNWHHKVITTEKHFNMIKNRDKIKINEIRKAGYKPYVINDYGNYDKEFVEQKFKELVDGYC